ncbi:MAG: glycoside hydrolase family 38 C-terminal domain-containing protein [Verrucomicrobiota bacterium]
MKKTFHLIANAHLDPVWLWDWHEGLNEGIITSRTILDLMDEIDDLTCIRGEAVVYQHIEKYDPKTFERIKKYVAAGRWDIVGGTYLQPDMNLTGTETMVRHFLRAKQYFRARFNKDVTVAWAADAFGHSAGLPEILVSAGMKGFAFLRPANFQLPLSKPAFWWIGSGGSRVMGYRPLVGSYYCERYDDIGTRLDECLKAASKSDIDNVGVYYGLGNHGGGPTRRLVEEIRKWSDKHPEVNVVHSGLHRLFKALYAEVARKGEHILPVYKGELNFCFRGCYASAAKLKFAFRKTEAMLNRAERMDTVISATLAKKPADLGFAWDALLFNSFHDILPGSSIERAYDDQLAWLGKAMHECRQTELTALNALADKVDTSVPRPSGDHPSAMSFLVWNPQSYEYKGPLELEACLDYRPIMAYTDKVDKLPIELCGPDKKPLPFQVVSTEHASFTNLAWRKRVVTHATLPPLGWSVFTLAWKEGATIPTVSNPVKVRAGIIDNGIYRIHAAKGSADIQVFFKGKPVFGKSGLGAITVEDPWGSWGGISEEPGSLDLQKIRYHWKISDVKTIESGPERGTLWVRMTGGHSHMDLMISVYRNRPAVDVNARVLWNERSARLKLVMPSVGNKPEFEVPGGVIRRTPCGEVPGGRWVRMQGTNPSFGFASDALYAFNCNKGALQATIARASRYADDRIKGSREELWRPTLDTGELKFRFMLSPGNGQLPRLAGELEQTALTVPVPPKKASLPRKGSLAELMPSTLRLLALKPAHNGQGWIIRVQGNEGRQTVRAKLIWLGKQIKLGSVHSRKIATWRIFRKAGRWKAEQILITEF